MNYLVKTMANLNGKDTLLTPLDVDYFRRIITLTGEITDESAALINSALRCLSYDSDEALTVYIQSLGGSVPAGLSIYDTMQAIHCRICTVACGMTASMAALLFTAGGTKGYRWIQPNAELLIHQPLGGVNGQATDVHIHAEHILNVRAKLNKILSASTGQPIHQIEADTERDKILDAQASVAYGLADRIGDPVSQQ